MKLKTSKKYFIEGKVIPEGTTLEIGQKGKEVDSKSKKSYTESRPKTRRKKMKEMRSDLTTLPIGEEIELATRFRQTRQEAYAYTEEGYIVVEEFGVFYLYEGTGDEPDSVTDLPILGDFLDRLYRKVGSKDEFVVLPAHEELVEKVQKEGEVEMLPGVYVMTQEEYASQRKDWMRMDDESDDPNRYPDPEAFRFWVQAGHEGIEGFDFVQQVYQDFFDVETI